MPRVSVIIPTYNRAHLIKEAIESVLAQTYADLELIVVDDGSTDETRAVVAGYGERVRYLHQNNAGASTARNRGLAEARGEYISFLDSDDWMLPHNVAALAQVLDARPEAGVAYGWYYWVDEHGNPMPWDRQLEGQQINPADTPWPGGDMAPYGMLVEGQALAALVLEDSMMMGSTLIRRACLEAVGGVDVTLAYHEHWDMYLRLALAGYEYANCRRPVVVLRRHAQNQSHHLDEMLASRLQVLTRVFADPRAAQISATVRARAFYRALIELAIDYYAGPRQFAQGAECVQRAVSYQPLEKRDMLALEQTLGKWALSSGQSDPVAAARAVIAVWPATREVERVRAETLRNVAAGRAFQHYDAGEYGQAWRAALGVVARYPGELRNRGLARIGAESLLGPRLFGWLRGRPAREHAGWIDELAGQRCVFISPHIDDAALSCGGLLAALARRGAAVELVTVFAGEPAADQPLSALARNLHQTWGLEAGQAVAVRRDEERAVAATLGAALQLLDFPDAIYRDARLARVETLFEDGYDPAGDPCYPAVEQALQALLGMARGAHIFVPLGIGGHRDHCLVHEVIRRLRSAGRVNGQYYYYEDYPYAATTQVQTRLARVGGQATPWRIDITDTLSERVRLVGLYRSQIEMLFGREENIAPRIAQYAARVGTRAVPCERYWTLSWEDGG